MSKLIETAIKIAYENRANAMIAAKRAAEESRLEKIKAWMKDPSNKGKVTALESGLGGLAAGGLGYGLTKALGGSNGWAWANAGMAGGGTAAGIAGLKYRKEIGEALKGLVKGKEEAKTEQKTLTPEEQLQQTNPAAFNAATGGASGGAKGYNALPPNPKSKDEQVAYLAKVDTAIKHLKQADPSNTKQDTAGKIAILNEARKAVGRGEQVNAEADKLLKAVLSDAESAATKNYPAIGSLNRIKNQANGYNPNEAKNLIDIDTINPKILDRLNAAAESGDPLAARILEDLQNNAPISDRDWTYMKTI